MRPYTEALAGMLSRVLASPSASGKGPGRVPQGEPGPGIATPTEPAHASVLSNTSASGEDSPSAPKSTLPHPKQYTNTSAYGEGGSRVAIVAVASNSSLCGAFNVNVVKRTLDEVAAFRKEGAEVEVIPVGRKMAEAMRKAGMPVRADYSDLVGHCDFEKAAAFAQTLIDSYNSGRYSRIIFIYNHFVSTSTQRVQVETYLPFSQHPEGLSSPQAGLTAPPIASDGPLPLHPWADRASGEDSPSVAPEEYILEPSREEILATLLPQVMRLRVYTVLMDSIAAEHAARMIAMQTATDNAEDLLGELTLEYNKGRQQKITSEILDLVGGAQQ